MTEVTVGHASRTPKRWRGSQAWPIALPCAFSSPDPAKFETHTSRKMPDPTTHNPRPDRNPKIKTRQLRGFVTSPRLLFSVASRTFRMIDLGAITVNLEQTSEGSWRCKSASPVSYPEWGNEACFQVEDVSFWFRHRNACILEAMKQYPPSGPVFDIGGGNGFVAKGMQDIGFEVVLLEPGAAGSRNAQRRGIQNVVCAGLEDAGFVPASMAAVGLFDVMEHIAEDRKFLEMVGSYLWANGCMYLTVSAYQALWSHEDVDAGHFRRYSRQTLRDLLKDAGFAVEFLTGFFQFLPPAILAGR